MLKDKNEYPFARLSSHDGEYVFCLYTYGYAYPDADNDYDADWQKNLITVNIPAFKVEIEETILEGSILKHYIDELQKFSKLIKDKVDFVPTESYFSISFSFNSRKNVQIKVEIEYPLGWGARLEFDFETDLTYIDKFIDGLQEIYAKFPSKRF